MKVNEPKWQNVRLTVDSVEGTVDAVAGVASARAHA